MAVKGRHATSDQPYTVRLYGSKWDTECLNAHINHWYYALLLVQFARLYGPVYVLALKYSAKDSEWFRVKATQPALHF